MFILPDLPYASDALEPVMSDVQLRTHHDKHHAAYVKNVNTMLEGQSPGPLEEVVRQAVQSQNRKLFNNAAQAWNHGFFWECMAPASTGGAPSGALAEAIQSAFGGMDQLKSRFVEEGATHFASGWAWIMANGPELTVISTHDADSGLVRDGTPILVCDVWEHAYYLDYKQDRKGFLELWFDKLVNWGFAERQYAAATGGQGGYRYPPPS